MDNKPVKEGFHPIKKMNNWMKTNEVIKAEKNNLTSVRVKLTYAIALVWTSFIYAMVQIVVSILNRLEPEQKAQVVTAVLSTMVNIFYVISFIFFIILMVYVLKRNTFKFSAWGISLDVGSADTPTTTATPQSTPVDQTLK